MRTSRRNFGSGSCGHRFIVLDKTEPLCFLGSLASYGSVWVDSLELLNVLDSVPLPPFPIFFPATHSGSFPSSYGFLFFICWFLFPDLSALSSDVGKVRASYFVKRCCKVFCFWFTPLTVFFGKTCCSDRDFEQAVATALLLVFV